MNKTLTAYIKSLSQDKLIDLFELVIEEINKRKENEQC